MSGKVESLGGVFIYSDNSKKLAEWYQEYLGLTHETWGDSGVYYVSFPYQDDAGTNNLSSLNINLTINKILNSNMTPIVKAV